MSQALLKLVNEEHDPSVPVKEAISTFVTLGYSDVVIKQDNGVYLWEGSLPNYSIYD